MPHRLLRTRSSVRAAMLGAAFACACACACASAFALAPAAGAATLRGDGGSERLRGTSGADRIFGRAGNDRLTGNRGRDRLSGGPGRDRLSGGPGRDRLWGGPGRDVLIGGTGRDTVHGGSGNDVIRLRKGGRDRVTCGRGRDRVSLDRDDRIADASASEPDGSCEDVRRPRLPDAYLTAAGDIADCDVDGDEITARLLDSLPGTVAVLGDAVYERGTHDEFDRCYAPTWGRHRARTRPAVGNHEYGTPGAAGYFDYFGAAAGPRGKGWYGYDLGPWHVIALNSNCAQVGCHPGSEQERWLRADLAAHPAKCTLAYMHHPRFSSGDPHGGSPDVEPLWRALHDHGAEIVLAGHDHDYERFAPQSPGGALDPSRGLRQFVVGTGGRSLRKFGPPQPNSESRGNTALGVLHLRLRDGSYEWRFVAEPGRVFADSGSDRCH